MLMTEPFLRTKFDQGVSYADFVAIGAPEGHDRQWHERHGRLALDPEQTKLVESFTREMNVLCLTGTWCGDCALQGAAMQRIAEANPDRIHLRFLLRSEEHADLIVPSMINAGFRVPVTWFMAEDFEPVARMGDRTLSRYRSMARKALGDGANVHAPPPEDPVREVLSEVLDEFERAHLLLRLSPRLRQLHSD
ncbi:MAG: thioredoxin family protein [Planctomycetota bacterium]|jgi:hypothetical protein